MTLKNMCSVTNVGKDQSGKREVKTLRRHMKAVTFTMFHVLDVHQF